MTTVFLLEGRGFEVVYAQNVHLGSVPEVNPTNLDLDVVRHGNLPPAHEVDKELRGSIDVAGRNGKVSKAHAAT